MGEMSDRDRVISKRERWKITEPVKYVIFLIACSSFASSVIPFYKASNLCYMDMCVHLSIYYGVERETEHQKKETATTTTATTEEQKVLPSSREDATL